MTDSIRVLHVDDDPEFVDMTAEFLERGADRFEIERAGDAAAGLDYLDARPVDCVVSDYKLPGRNGIEFLEAVRERDGDLPFILFTGRGSEEVASRAISAGATDYFRKAEITENHDLLINRITNAVSAAASKQRVENRVREYRTLVNEAPVTMVIVGKDLEIRYANATAVETLGATDSTDLVGTAVEEMFPDPVLEATAERLERVLEQREPVETREFRFFDLDGNVRYGRGTIVPVTFEGEGAAQAVVEDVTERKRNEIRVQEQRERIAKLHGVGVELASCESPQTVYERMVDTAEEILDLDLCVADSVEDGSLIVEATSSELTEYEEAPLEEGGIAGKAYRTGESFLIDDTTAHPEADPVDEFGSAITVPIGEFGVFQAVAYEEGIFDDVDLEMVEILVGHAREALTRLEHESQLTEQRDRLRRENERLDEFASIISHDLRNPLNVAQLRLDLAIDECDSQHLDAVERAVDRMETLTDELLALARQGEEVTDYEVVAVADLASQCWHTVQTSDATLGTATDVRIRADSSRVQQLLENLMRNAIEHGGEDVTVTIGELDDRPGFYVEDDGVGMAPDVRERAFESGFSTSENGTGFGLAIVDRVAEAHGWEVTATDGDEGGARFEFTGVEFVS